MREILTVAQAAEYLQVNPETVRRAARAGRLPAARIGRQWRIRRADLDRLFTERLIDRALAEEAERRLAAGGKTVPWEQVKAESRAQP